MIPDKIFEIGSKLGLQHRDIKILTVKRQTSKSSIKTSSPMETYKSSGGDYGTISINHF